MATEMILHTETKIEATGKEIAVTAATPPHPKKIFNA
jgi:hypothetical protein